MPGSSKRDIFDDPEFRRRAHLDEVVLQRLFGRGFDPGFQPRTATPADKAGWSDIPPRPDLPKKAGQLMLVVQTNLFELEQTIGLTWEDEIARVPDPQPPVAALASGSVLVQTREKNGSMQQATVARAGDIVDDYMSRPRADLVPTLQIGLRLGDLANSEAVRFALKTDDYFLLLPASPGDEAARWAPTDQAAVPIFDLAPAANQHNASGTVA